MTSDNANRRPVVFAAIAASFMILIFGLTHRALVARLTVFMKNKTPIDPAVLEQFPLQIGDWIGQDVPADEAIVDMAGTDAHIFRRYSRSSGLESVLLYVACGVKAKRVLCRRPPASFIAVGFSLVDRRSMELLLDNGIKLPCSIFRFFRGGLDTKKVTVLHYLISDGQYFDDVSVSLLNTERGIRVVGYDYVAHVQIIASTESLTDDSATKLVSAFAVDSALSIAQLFKDLEEGRSSGEFHESLIEK